MECLKIDVLVNTPLCSELSEREMTVRKIFGLGRNQDTRVLHRDVEVATRGLIYITGFSGSGKSCLLREIGKHFPNATTAAPEIDESQSVLECFAGEVSEVIQWLGIFGLGEAQLLLTPVKFISVGQKERLKLALLLWSKPQVIIVDEFLTALDRVTARVIAHQFQKLVRRFGITAFVATAHDDLIEALHADQTLRLDFENLHVTSAPNPNAHIPELAELVIETGSLKDYEVLKRFHYMESQVGDDGLRDEDVVMVRKASFRGTIVGVRVFTKIFPASYERVGIFKLINQKAVLSSRVVVHPAFRGLGISSRLDWDFAGEPEVDAVFTHSALAKHFPFDLRSGYTPLKHVSVERTPYHLHFEETLKNAGLARLEDLNDPALAQVFWESLDECSRGIVRNALVDVLVDYDFRYVLYVAESLRMNVPKAAEHSLKKFFYERLARIRGESFWRVLSEGLYFPMQGLVRQRREERMRLSSP